MNFISNFLETISKDKNDIYLFGAGFVADVVKKFLEENNIGFCGYLVDPEYLPENESDRYIDGKPVITDKDLSSDVSVIVAVNPEKFIPNIKITGFIKKLYWLDFNGPFLLNTKYNLFDDDYMYENHTKLIDTAKMLQDFESRRTLMMFVAQKYAGCYFKDYSHNPEYFDDDILCPNEDEVFIDCGAYNGDSTLGFLKWLKQNNINSYKKCIAFEPDNKNFEEMKRNLAFYKDIELYNIGTHERKDVLHFAGDNKTASRFAEIGGVSVTVDSIDNILKGEKATYIKMDIEGSELSALKVQNRQ
ncbi:MAG: FkbM family methyltransferase [Ruminiclostridium sp.]|nr:FkbM family methyltransferase [Ruminiclostridium sp.]